MFLRHSRKKSFSPERTFQKQLSFISLITSYPPSVLSLSFFHPRSVPDGFPGNNTGFSNFFIVSEKSATDLVEKVACVLRQDYKRWRRPSLEDVFVEWLIDGWKCPKVTVTKYNKGPVITSSHGTSSVRCKCH